MGRRSLSSELRERFTQLHAAYSLGRLSESPTTVLVYASIDAVIWTPLTCDEFLGFSMLPRLLRFAASDRPLEDFMKIEGLSALSYYRS